MREIDTYYHQLPEPVQSCFLAIQEIISGYHEDIEELWRYKTPFFYFKGKPFCYLYFNRKKNLTYLGIVKGKFIDHPLLERGNRSYMKILPFNPDEDLPITEMFQIFELMKVLY